MEAYKKTTEANVEKLHHKPSKWWLVLGIVGMILAAGFGWLLLTEHRLEFSQDMIRKNLAKVLEARSAAQENRAAEQAAREARCQTELSRDACREVKEKITDAIKIESADVTLGKELLKLEFVATGEYRGRTFRIPLSGIGEPDYRASSSQVFFKATRVKAGDITFNGESAVSTARKNPLIKGIGRILGTDPEDWDKLVGWGAERLEDHLKRGAERLAIETLGHVPVYTLQAKPDDSQWKKIQMALARLSLKSATVENEKLVIVLSGSHAVLTALGFIGAACIVGLMIFGLASAGIIF